MKRAQWKPDKDGYDQLHCGCGQRLSLRINPRMHMVDAICRWHGVRLTTYLEWMWDDPE